MAVKIVAVPDKGAEWDEVACCMLVERNACWLGMLYGSN